MRIHHHDSAWVEPNIFDKKFKDSGHLSARSLDSLDWWIKSLKDEGIYIWLDMHVGRLLMPGDDVRSGRDDINRDKNDIKGFCYYNRDLQNLMKEFQHSYLNHTNPYTKLRYKDDAAVVGILITNENDLSCHFGYKMLPDLHFDTHSALFTRGYKAFAREHGLPESRVYQTWLPGPSKMYLSDVEHQFNQVMIGDLKQIGVRSPIATTNFWGEEGIYALPSLSEGDVIDVHSYGASEAMSVNPRLAPNYISWINTAHVGDKPLTITEWNVPYPSVDRFTAPLYIASIAALQGWEAPMLYDYSHVILQAPSNADQWSTFIDPALSGVMPAAALAYRQGHISAARRSYSLQLDPKQLFDRDLSPKTSATIRTLTELSKLTVGIPSVKELPWLKPTPAGEGTTVVSDPDRDFIPEGQSFIRSDTGELLRNWKFGIQVIDTPKTQAVSGWIENKTLKTQDASFLFSTKKAVVALSSMDNQPLSVSRFVLITAVARAVAPNNRMPFFTEPVTGTIVLKTQSPDLELLALHSDGRAIERVALKHDNDGVTIPIPSGRGTHWFVLKPSTPSKEAGPGNSPPSN
jgi:hypothetical protein